MDQIEEYIATIEEMREKYIQDIKEETEKSYISIDKLQFYIETIKELDIEKATIQYLKGMIKWK